MTRLVLHRNGPVIRIFHCIDMDQGVFNLKVIIPPNTTAAVCLPAEKSAVIECNGAAFENAPGARLLTRDDSEARFDVTSGTHQFRVKGMGGRLQLCCASLMASAQVSPDR